MSDPTRIGNINLVRSGRQSFRVLPERLPLSVPCGLPAFVFATIEPTRKQLAIDLRTDLVDLQWSIAQILYRHSRDIAIDVCIEKRVVERLFKRHRLAEWAARFKDEPGAIVEGLVVDQSKGEMLRGQKLAAVRMNRSKQYRDARVGL